MRAEKSHCVREKQLACTKKNSYTNVSGTLKIVMSSQFGPPPIATRASGARIINFDRKFVSTPMDFLFWMPFSPHLFQMYVYMLRPSVYKKQKKPTCFMS